MKHDNLTIPDQGTVPPDQTRSLSRWPVTILRPFLTVAFPVFLVLTSVRLVATEAFIQLEYHRPGFPEDRFGFTQEDRLKYAPHAVRYMLNDADISYLGDLTFDDGEPLYTTKELEHMEDVKVVARAAFTVHTLLSLALAVTVIVLAWRPETRRALRQGLFAGSALTVSLIITLVVLLLANWDFFFDGFHSIFFEGDSWQFSTSDTLIRLFPQQFWFDAAISIGLLTVLGTLSAMLGARYWERRSDGRLQ